MLMLLACLEIVLSFFQVKIPVLLLWLIYVGSIGPIYLWFNVRKYVHSGKLEEGYDRIFFRKDDYNFPQDDFLG